jgi:hypothetical protein
MAVMRNAYAHEIGGIRTGLWLWATLRLTIKEIDFMCILNFCLEILRKLARNFLNWTQSLLEDKYISIKCECILFHSTFSNDCNL